MPILHSAGLITPGQLGPMSLDFDFDRFKSGLHTHHVELRDPLSDAYDERHLRFHGFHDRCIREGSRHVDHGRITIGFLSHLRYGPEYIIPLPFDPRLISAIPPAVAQAAVDTGVAQRERPDL